MTQKIIFQAVVLVALFFGIWFGLSQINYVDRTDVEKFSKENEKKLSELILKSIRIRNREIEDDSAKAIIDTIGRRICAGRDIPYDSIKIHIVKSDEVNAFALPDNNMIIYTGLIDYAKNAEEVAGVMAHEIGHMQNRHVMKKLIKEIGFAMLFTIAGGDAGYEIIREATRVLSSTAFDRRQESEADTYAVEMMAKADIDPENMANFLFRLAKDHDMPEELVWVSTHPESKERAAEILAKKKKYKFESKPILKTSWDNVKQTFRQADSMLDSE
jgi:beta-barrel assembly-enhancing protease